MPRQRTSHQLLNLTLNILIPSFVMINLSPDHLLGPVLALIFALIFPIGYGLFAIIYQKKLNFFSLIGVISTLLTGTISIFSHNNFWLILKETGLPLFIGVAILVSHKTKYPLVRTFLGEIIDIHKIDSAFQQAGHRGEFETLLIRITWLLGFSYLIASLLNLILAQTLISSTPGTSAYTQEVGRMTALSFPLIGIPMTVLTGAILIYLLHFIKRHTRLNLEDVFL